MSENSLREITQQIDHLAESYDIHHSNLAGILNHVKNERDALNQMESELTQSRAESALLVEKLEKAKVFIKKKPIVSFVSSDRVEFAREWEMERKALLENLP